MPSKPTVYWDSCVFIDWMKQDKPERVMRIQPVVDAGQHDGVLIVTSAWTLVEVVRTRDGCITDSADEATIVNFMKNDFIEIRPLDRRTAEKSRQLQRLSAAAGMKMPKADSVHMATAILAAIPVLHTFDDAHLLPHSGKWGDPPLLIQHPWFGPSTEPSHSLPTDP